MDTSMCVAKTLCYSPVTTKTLLIGHENEGGSHSDVSDSLRSYGLLCPWDFPGMNTGVGCHSLLQGIFVTRIAARLYYLSH